MRIGFNIKNQRRYFSALAFILLFCMTTHLHAWGARGHDIITQLAIYLLQNAEHDRQIFSTIFKRHEKEMVYLSNVPDRVWRASSMGDSERKLNATSHYINLEYLDKKPLGSLQQGSSYQEARRIASEQNIDLVNKMGTAPWRVVQLFELMKSELAYINNTRHEKSTVHLNKAFLYADLMSHFVGDLANPHHTTRDHDGFMTGNGGLHAYFEGDVVFEMERNFLTNVISHLDEPDYLDINLLGGLNDEQKIATLNEPQKLIFSLIINSYQNLPNLISLDDKYSILTRSKDTKPASRRPAAEVSEFYESFLTDRLTLAAHVLSHLWFLAWQQAGTPDLSAYPGFDYPQKPAFIFPDYVAN
jgi:hypothetical protein